MIFRKNMVDAVYANEHALLINTRAQAESKQAAQNIGLYVYTKENYIYFEQKRAISTSKISRPVHIARQQDLID